MSPGPRPTTSISSDPEAVQDRRVSTNHRSGMNPAELRDRCLSLPGGRGDISVRPQDLCVKVAGRMFALSQLGAASLRVSLKCEPQLAEALRGAYAAVLPGYHLNKRHWKTVIIDGSLSEQMIKDLIEDSYDLVVSQLPTSRRRALGSTGDAVGIMVG